MDCGIKVLRCCNTPRWRKLGTTTTFLTVLILLAIVQGISEKFISISAQQAALEHDYDPDIVGKTTNESENCAIENERYQIYLHLFCDELCDFRF